MKLQFLLIHKIILLSVRDLVQNLRYQYSMYKLQHDNPTLSIGRNVIIKNFSALKIGQNVTIQDNCYLHCGGMEWCNYEGGIELEDNAFLGTGTIIWGTGATVRVGRHTVTAQNVQIYASTEYRDNNDVDTLRSQFFKFQDVNIDDGAGLYSNSVVGPGVTVGKNARVSANSLALKDVKPDTLVAGIPARHVKTLNAPIVKELHPEIAVEEQFIETYSRKSA